MNQRLIPGIFMISTVLFWSCNSGHTHEHPAEVNIDSVRTQIAAMENLYAAATNAKDAEAIASYYADDAQSLAADEPTRVGKEAIRAGIMKELQMDTSGHTISFEVTGVWAAGNYATETGSSTVKDKDGKVVRTGKYMTLFELRNGKYVAIRDIWNNDAPNTPDTSPATSGQ